MQRMKPRHHYKLRYPNPETKLDHTIRVAEHIAALARRLALESRMPIGQLVERLLLRELDARYGYEETVTLGE